MGVRRRAGPRTWRAFISFRVQGRFLRKWERRMFRLLRWLFRRRQPRVTHMQWIVAENVKATTNLRGNRLRPVLNLFTAYG